MTLDDLKRLNIPTTPGVYQFFDKDGKLMYIGKASNLKNRVSSYWQKSANHSPAKFSMLKQIEKIKWVETKSEIEALLLESNLIKKYKPPFNIVMRDDKRYIYIKVSTEDEIPSVFTTRKIEKSGKYYGPFVSATAAKETVKAIRKIWPYCSARKLQNKPCFHYQINLCLGVCAGVISRKEYMDKVIKPIMLFFEGKKNRIIKDYELQIKNSEKKIKKEVPENEQYENLEKEINNLKYKLINIRRVLEHAHILGLEEKYANDVIELAKVLGLNKVPARIEGYDIANIFGREAVGSMVVFSGGEPDKNEYRKFKIKIGEGEANDVRMLREILERRFKHVPNTPLIKGARGIKKGEETNPPIPPYQGGESWALPDLIIIDGGKGQLNAAVSVLKKAKLDIPVIGISKGEGLRSAGAPDKLFFPGEKKPLELPLASPALHLIKRVRDEAHRFAITYHRNLRSKRLNH